MAISEIYCRSFDDPYYDNLVMDTKTEIEALLSKVRLILSTRKGDLLADPDFGVDLEQYIFETNVDVGSIRKDVEEQFAKYIPESTRFDISVKAGLIQNDIRNNVIVDILINKEKILGFVI